MGSVSPRQTFVLITLFVAMCVSFIILDDQTVLNPLKTGLRDLVTPVTNFVYDSTEPSVSEGEWETRFRELEERHALLEADYQRSRVIADQVEELQALLDLQQTSPDISILPANVISVDPTGTNEIIVIDRGSVDGVAVGMAVTDAAFFVGVVTRVDDGSAQVLLAIDSTHTVGAELETSRATGVAFGMWQQGGRIELRYVDRNIEVEPEEKVVTTCSPEVRTANMPCGLIIGKVSGEPQADPQGGVQSFQVIPAADFDDLTVVAVITSDGQGE